MSEMTKIVDLLQTVVPAEVPLTVQSEVRVLEVLRIVKDPQLVTVMNLVAELVPPSTPATLKGLVKLLGALMRISGKAKSSHHDSITSVLTKLDATPDVNLTFGTFLSICQTLTSEKG